MAQIDLKLVVFVNQSLKQVQMNVIPGLSKEDISFTARGRESCIFPLDAIKSWEEGVGVPISVRFEYCPPPTGQKVGRQISGYSLSAP